MNSSKNGGMKNGRKRTKDVGLCTPRSNENAEARTAILKHSSGFDATNEKRGTTLAQPLHFIILFPALARRRAGQQGVGDFVVRNLPRREVKLQLGIQPLRDTSNRHRLA